jgi:hypothetical protein
MAKKTWKIGEYAKGGVIVTETKGNTVTIIGKDWDFSTGSRKSSNQSNAKEFTRLSVDVNSSEANKALTIYLNELTTSYYADQILNWIQTNSKFVKQLFW